jgi:LysM repeat protein
VPNSSGSASNSTAGSQAAADPSQYIYAVTLATPQADGTIKHKVLYGQTLISISEAYGITINELRILNNMEANDTVIWPDQELLINTGSGAAEPQAESTPKSDAISTGTPTAVVPTLTSQPNPAATVVPTTFAAQSTNVNARPDPMPGLMLLGISGFVLIILLYFSPARK